MNDFTEFLNESFSVTDPIMSLDRYSRGEKISDEEKESISRLHTSLQDITEFEDSWRDKTKKVRRIENHFESLNILQETFGYNFFENQEKYKGLSIHDASEMVYDKLVPVLSDLSLVLSGKEISKERAEELRDILLDLSKSAMRYGESIRHYLAA